MAGCAKQKNPEVAAPKPVVDDPKPAVGAPSAVVDFEKLEERDSLGYFEGKPFTGVAVKKYPNGQKRMENTFKDGKRHGLETDWFENGQKQFEITWKDGEFISAKEWDEDGNPK